MRTNLFKTLSFLLLLLMVFAACDEVKDSLDDTQDEKLYVRFTNDAESEYTISSIHILNMGVAGTLETPTGEFSKNILGDGVTIAPGEHVFFYLDIPNSNYAYCRLGIIDDQGNQIMMHDQVDYTATYEGTFTHWGSHERDVEATIGQSEFYPYIYVKGWSEWAGITY